VRLAAERSVAAVVLEAPLTSTVDVARRTYFWLPLGLLITDKYNNERNIRSVTAPVLVLHGEQDAVIPVEMGWRIAIARLRVRMACSCALICSLALLPCQSNILARWPLAHYGPRQIARRVHFHSVTSFSG
jgi:hypothetical protein